MSTEQNKAIARRYVEEVWNNGNLSVIEELVSPDFVSHGPGPFESDRNALITTAEFTMGVRVATGNSGRETIEAILTDGDMVAVWTKGDVTYSPDRYFPPEVVERMRNNQAEGLAQLAEQTVTMTVRLFRLREGKISEAWLFSNAPLISPRSAERSGATTQPATNTKRRRRRSRRR